MSKKIIGVTLAGLGIAGSFAGGMVLSNNIKDDNYTIVLAEKEEDIASISGTLDNLDKQIAEKDAQISLLKTAQAELQEKYDNLVATNSATEEELANLQTQYDELVASNSATQEELDALQTQYNELKATSDADKAEIDRLNSNIEELETTIASLESQLAESTRKYNELQESYTQLQEEYDALLAQSEVDKQEIDSLNASINDLNNQIADLQEEIENLEVQLENADSEVSIDFSSFGLSGCEKFKLTNNKYFCYSGNGIYLVNLEDNSVKNIFGSVDDADFHLLSNGNVLFSDRDHYGVYLYLLDTDTITQIYDKGYNYSYFFDIGNGICFLGSGQSSSNLLKYNYITGNLEVCDSSFVYCSSVKYMNKYVLINSTGACKTYLYDIESDSFSVVFEDFGFNSAYIKKCWIDENRILLSSQNSSNKGVYLFDFTDCSLTKISDDLYSVSSVHLFENKVYFTTNSSFYVYDFETNNVANIDLGDITSTSNPCIFGITSSKLLCSIGSDVFSIDINDLSVVKYGTASYLYGRTYTIYELANNSDIVYLCPNDYGDILKIDLVNNSLTKIVSGIYFVDGISLPNGDLLLLFNNMSLIQGSGLSNTNYVYKVDSLTGSNSRLFSYSNSINGRLSYSENDSGIIFDCFDRSYLYDIESGNITLYTMNF